VNYYDTFSPSPASQMCSAARNENPQDNFHSWKEQQITRFVRRCYAEVKSINPELIFSTAVISNIHRASSKYSQNWLSWINEGIVDYVYTMTYAYTDEAVKSEIQAFDDVKDRIVVGLRAWREGSRAYSASDIISKIELVRKHDFSGLAMFSYSGIKGLINNDLRKSLISDKSKAHSHSNIFLYGYVTDNRGSSLANVRVSLNSDISVMTDSNGFYLFSGLPENTYWIKAEKGKRVFFSDSISLISPTGKTKFQNYDILFH